MPRANPVLIDEQILCILDAFRNILAESHVHNDALAKRLTETLVAVLEADPMATDSTRQQQLRNVRAMGSEAAEQLFCALDCYACWTQL